MVCINNNIIIVKDLKFKLKPATQEWKILHH